MRTMRRAGGLAWLVAALVLLVAACGTDNSVSSSSDSDGSRGTAAADDDHADDGHDDDHADDGHDDDHGDESFTFGMAADEADADRVIEVEAHDDFSFTPNEVEVAVGETVTFEITNTGVLEHDFTLGDEETQDEHEQEMKEMKPGEMHHGDANAVLVEGGETASITWTFTEPGTVLFGCHVVGHYDNGMKGTITVVEAS